MQLFATTRSFPVFESAVVTLPKGRVVQYKCAVLLLLLLLVLLFLLLCVVIAFNQFFWP